MDHPATVDRISDLPWNVLNSILICVPLRTAVRTSILSRKWRYKWTTLSQLDFSFCGIVDQIDLHDEALKTKYVNIVNRVMLFHTGLVDSCLISGSFRLNSYDVDQWMPFLSRNGIKVLELRYGYCLREPCLLPSCLFSFEQLNTLILGDCILKPPPTFQGFSKLVCLLLQKVSVTDDELVSFIRRCPALERLTLVIVQGLASVKIDAPNLKYLRLVGEFEDVCLRNCTLLCKVSIVMESDTLTRRSKTCNLVRVLGSLSCLESFHCSEDFLQFLAIGKVPERLPTSYNHLKLLALFTDLEDLDEILVVMALLRSYPELQELVINNEFDGEMEIEPVLETEIEPVLDYLKALQQSSISFTRLTFARISITGSRPGLEFIKLVLARSPALETMSVDTISGTQLDVEDWKEVLEMERTSPRAEVKWGHED